MKKYLLAMVLFLSFGVAPGCEIVPPVTPPSTPPAPPEPCDVSTADIGSHVWGDSGGAFHLAHDSLSPAVINESDYAPDLSAWNALETPVTLRGAGEGFKIRVIEGGDSSSGWLGLASVTFDSRNHITSATVTMNRTLLAKYAAPVAEHVLCQELGHLLGLDHQRDADDSCMDDCQGRGEGWLSCLSSEAGKTPNAHDAEQLREIYEHVTPGTDPPAPPCIGTIVLHAFPVE